jgi:hypothetical protein
MLAAVNAYFNDNSINGPTRALAVTLDTLATAAVDSAFLAGKSTIDSMPGDTGRQKNRRAALLTDLQNAKVGS